MKEQLIAFKTAVLAKEKGFGLGKDDYIQLHTIYTLDKKLYNDGEFKCYVGRVHTNSPNHLGADTIDNFEGSIFTIDNSLDEYILAPTQSLLQTWLRELDILVIVTFAVEFYVEIWDIRNGIMGSKVFDPIFQTDNGPKVNYKDKTIGDFQTWEEALEVGLQEALKII
jgi:WD40 repeat protein